MLWEVESRGAKRVAEIAKAVRGAEKLILATDPDREGEAISWHVVEALREKKLLKDLPIERVTFNAITKDAVAAAMRSPRQIDGALVDAYWRAARSTTSSASRSRPCSGASYRVRARRAGSNRLRSG
jgi:DNA topoisomerase-1